MLKGDFIGFTLDGVHSSELGLLRVSEGNRYQENLVPTIKDKVVAVPGGDGSYYFGSNFTQKNITINIAYDNLTEENLRRLKRIMGQKKIMELIFDENPYKVYRVKSTGSPSLKFISFDSDSEANYDMTGRRVDYIKDKKTLYNFNTISLRNRIYKGEGQLTFISYSPFAVSRFKYLNEYNTDTIPEWRGFDNLYEDSINYNLWNWREASGLKNQVEGLDELPKEKKTGTFYNPGDIETPFILTVKKTDLLEQKVADSEQLNKPEQTDKSESLNFEFWVCDSKGDRDREIIISKLFLEEGDVGFQINSKIHLIEGFTKDGELSGKIYNQYISKGDFFRLPVTKDLQGMEYSSSDDNIEVEIDYKYLYY